MAIPSADGTQREEDRLGPVLFFAWHEQGEKYFWLQIWLQSCKFWLEFYVHGRITVCLGGTGENTENKRKFP